MVEENALDGEAGVINWHVDNGLVEVAIEMDVGELELAAQLLMLHRVIQIEMHLLNVDLTQ